jgi:hypothetical protein
LTDHVEVERLRAAAAAEITTEEVQPIQTDFHFFVKENLDKHRKLAEEEVRKTNGGASTLDPFLVNTNLNTRLMKAWEGLTKEQRESYMVREEEDRRRFMEEDEIASRHCATLTARGKSPGTNSLSASNNNNSRAEENKSLPADKGGKEECDDGESKTSASPDRDLSGVKSEILEDSNGEEDEKKTDGVEREARAEKDKESEADTSKRPAPTSSDKDADTKTLESPTKRNKVSEVLVAEEQK